MPAARIRKSAIAMMIVAGGLAAAVSAPPVHAQSGKELGKEPGKGTQTIPCDMRKEKRTRQKITIPCDARKSAKKAGVMNPCEARRKSGAMNPCEAKRRRGADKLGDIK